MAKFPSLTLAASVEGVELLFKEIQRGEVDGPTAAKALGYSGENGAARTKLAAMNAYGLITRSRSMVAVSELGIAIAHPLGDSRKKGLAEASLKPPLFQKLWNDHRQLSEKVLASTLVHQGFNQNDADDAARTYKENIKFAGVDGVLQSPPPKPQDNPTPPPPAVLQEGGKGGREARTNLTNVLATYTIPLGANEAQLTFTGSTLEPADFDALIDYVNLFKKQFERRPNVYSGLFPKKAIWKNKDHDQPVTVLGISGQHDGVMFYRVEGSETALPQTELVFITG